MNNNLSKKLAYTKNLYTRILNGWMDNPQRSLTRAYIGALGLIAVLTIISHSLTAYITNNQRADSEITFAMTNLRSSIDVINSRAAAYKASKNSFDYELLNYSIDELKEKRSNINKHGGSTVYSIFRIPPFFLDKKIDDFISMSEKFASYQNRGGYQDAEEQNETNSAFDILTNNLSKTLVINLNLALEQFHASVADQIELSFKLQYIGALTILSILFLEALFIFRPLVLRLDKYHKDLLRLALEDELTGLRNRRAFMQRAAAELSSFSRSKKPFALILADLDKFKSVNDTYGHKVGDLVLRHYSSLMLKSLRKYDVIGRIGGEEFAIFLPDTNADDALIIINRARESVMKTPCPYIDRNGQKQNLSYTSSFGIVSVLSGKDILLDTLLIKADECLYKAKDQGRNCAVIEILKDHPPQSGISA